MNYSYTNVRRYFTSTFAVLCLAGGLCVNNTYAQQAKAMKKSNANAEIKNRPAEISTEQDTQWQKGGLFEGFSPQQELIEKRSKNVKHFRNQDGSVTAQIGRTLHYIENGVWKDIDFKVLEGNTGKVGYNFKNETNEIKTYFPQTPGTNGVSMKLADGTEFNWWKNPILRIVNNGQSSSNFTSKTVQGKVNSNKLVYPNIYNGISEEFVILADGLESNTIIHSLTSEIASLATGAKLEFTQFIPLKNGWQLYANGKIQNKDFETKDFSIRFPGMENNIYFGRIVVFDNNISKEDALLIDGPSEKLTAKQKSDLAQSVYTITYKIKFVQGGVEIISSLPASWLQSASRTYPVVIDPTVTITPPSPYGSFYTPLSHWFGYQRTASLFLQSEIGAYGNITQIEFNSTNEGTAGSVPTKVFMRSTANSTITGSDPWNSSTYTSGAALCLDANTDQGNTMGWKALSLTTPFQYDQGNLLIMIYDAWGGSGSTKYYNLSAGVTARQGKNRQDNTNPGDGAAITPENYLPEIRITYSALSVCTGVPALGLPTASATQVCPGSSFSLNLDITPPASGFSYQWQSSTDGGTTWANLGAPQTNSTYIATSGQTVATSYRVIVTCVPSSTADTSGVVTVSIAPPTDCYCIPAPASNCTLDDVIENVTFAGINNNSSCTLGYGNYTTSVAPGNITSGIASLISVTVANGGNEAVAAWIDYNQNGIFEMSEYTYIGNTPGGTVNANIMVPSSALTGLTRMRVRSFYVATGDPLEVYTLAADPVCGAISTNFGETEDYTVNIIAGTLCAGTPIAGTAASTLSTVCPNVPFTLTSDGTLAAGLSFQWQSSTDGTTWTDLGPVQSGLAYTVSSQSVTTQYRVIYTCTASNNSNTSTAVTVTQTPMENCYCTPVLDCTDDDLILNVTLATINNNSTCGVDGYTNYSTTVATPDLNIGNSYPISVTVGSGWAYESVSVWVDFNQNGVFDTDEFTYIATGSNTALTGSISIPSTAMAGNTVMRVRVAAVGDANATSDMACDETQGYGETEDYMVNLMAIPIIIDSVVVKTIGNVAAVISTPSGTLPLIATVYPTSMAQTVTWGIIPVTGAATISTTGVVTAQANGTVWAKATSTVNTAKSDSILITINAPVDVDSVVVKTVGNIAAAISIPSGTLPLVATVYPASMGQTVTWTIIPVTGAASISATGVVTAQANGTVWAKATSTVNTSRSGSILITITNQDLGVNTIDGFDFNLYPNPSDGLISLKSTNTHEALDLKVIDLTGKVLSIKTLPSNALNEGVVLDLGNYALGMYILKLEGDNVNIQRQIIKK